MSVQQAYNLQELFATAQLPGLPQTAIRLLEISQDSANGPEQFAVPIEADPGLTAQVLKFVNSSYFGFSREITSVKLAITLVGIRTIKNFVLWTAVFSLMPNPRCGSFDLRKLRQDSLRRGLFARNLSRVFGLRDVEEPFAAALLQDVAVPILAQRLPGEYAELFAARDHDKRRLSELEFERFGWTHAEAGAEISTIWNLPPAFASLIGQHCDLDRLIGCAKQHPAEFSVAASSLLPSAHEQVWRDLSHLEQAYQITRPDDAPTFEQLLDQLDTDYQDFAPLLKLPPPSKKLGEMLKEAREAAAC